MAKLRLAEILKSRKMSKRQFAILVGMEYNNVFRIFRSGYDPKLSSLDRWAKALGLKINDLIKD